MVRCLESVREAGVVIYVDSGSTDGSVTRARGLGADVVELDMTMPFTAARARNAGFARLRELKPSVRFVQFVDGDCELRETWLATGAAALEADPAIAAVCGRLRERHPERSIYNRMCDIGWDYPIGEIQACGGVAMYSAELFAAAKGFNDGLIAGEEFELCSRLRKAGGRIRRIDAEMAWHDVGITRLGQWWKRAVRAGFSYAEGWAVHAREVGGGHRRSAQRAMLWGLALPAIALVGAAGSAIWLPMIVLPVAALCLCIFQLARLAFLEARRGRPAFDAASFAVFLLLAKLPEAHGAVQYWLARARGRRPRIIEYR